MLKTLEIQGLWKNLLIKLLSTQKRRIEKGLGSMNVLTIRAHKRYAVRQPVRLCKTGGKPIDGLMIELSSEGCRISNLGRPGLAIGETVTVKIDEHTYRGRIRWSHDGIAGVRLDQALFGNELSNLVMRGRVQPQEEIRRYGT